MPRLARLSVAYVSLLLAVIVAGFLGSALGIWASILWGAALIGGVALYARRRMRRKREVES